MIDLDCRYLLFKMIDGSVDLPRPSCDRRPRLEFSANKARKVIHMPTSAESGCNLPRKGQRDCPPETDDKNGSTNPLGSYFELCKHTSFHLYTSESRRFVSNTLCWTLSVFPGEFASDLSSRFRAIVHLDERQNSMI